MTLTNYTARSVLSIGMYMEKMKTMGILETIAALDLKVGRSRQLMKVCNLLRSRSFLDLGPMS